MNDEIKEILEKLKDGTWYNELDLTGTMWIELRWEETHLLLDYITNLQQYLETAEYNYKALNEDVIRIGKLMGFNSKEHIIVSEHMDEWVKNIKKENERLKLEIERLNDVLVHKPDEKIMLKTNDGKELFIIQSERIDMQEELNKTITTLYERINKAREELNKHSPDVDGLFTIMWNARNILRGDE